MIALRDFIIGILFTLFLLPLSSSVTHAHFTVGTDARVIHVAASKDRGGIHIFLRIPGPLAYGEVLSKRRDVNEALEAPFLNTEVRGNVPYYSINEPKVRANISEFARFLAGGYILTLEGDVVHPEVIDAGFFRADDHPEYTDPAGAQDALKAFKKIKPQRVSDPLYIADALFDLELFLPTQAQNSQLSIRNALPEILLPPEVVIENLVVDHRFNPPRSIQFRGQMMKPLLLDGSLLHALGNFIWQGVVHILIGLDHVLFVVCLVLASGISLKIFWSVTGFTIGHSITLYLGSIGLVPHGLWFIPAVETAIAASILLAALLVLVGHYRPKAKGVVTGATLLVISAVIGLIHGYGFSFVLGDLLGGDGSRLILALIGFNLGVEVGQLGIVALVFALLWIARKLHRYLPMGLSYVGAFVAIAMSLRWCMERITALYDMI